MMRKILALIIAFLLVECAFADESFVHVTADLLNGRMKPTKHSPIEALFDYGDTLTLTGKWSKDHKWIQVLGGETPFVWVNINYVSETVGPYVVKNVQYDKIKIRKHPVNGKISGYLKKDECIEIERDVNGWGYCSKGWIDLSLVEEVYGDDFESSEELQEYLKSDANE